MTMIRRAKYEDFEGINELLSNTQFSPIFIDQINDLSFVAEDENKIVGFVWCMMSSGNKIAYVDQFCVDKYYVGVGVRLINALVEEATKIGLEYSFSYVQNDESVDSLASFKINFALGLRCNPRTFHCFTGKPKMIGRA